jgi:predicted TIM-barrel fold metal-dependent hydrolase
MSTPTLDVFTHFMPSRFLQAFREHAPNRGMVRRSLQVKPLCDLEARFRLMDEFENYRQVISLGSPPIETFADSHLSLELTRIANDGLAELVDRHPGRFAGFLAAVPMNTPDAAVDEIRRAAHVLGASGVQVYSNVAGQPLDSPQFSTVFDCLDAEGLPLFLHPARNERFADYAMEEKSQYEIWWALGWPYETSAAMARLVFSGAFDRWPNLKVVTHHLGGIVPYVAGRVGHGWDQLGKRTSDEDYFVLLRSLKRRPLDYFKMFYADTAQFGSEASTRCGVDFFGVDHVLFASDCPYEPSPGIYIRETLQVIRNLGLSEDEREKICVQNARRLMPHLRPTASGRSE